MGLEVVLEDYRSSIRSFHLYINYLNSWACLESYFLTMFLKASSLREAIEEAGLFGMSGSECCGVV
jgi:hypothetical protein